MKIEKINKMMFEDLFDSDGGKIISIVAESDEKNLNSIIVPDQLPILPLRNMVPFPGVIFPVVIGRAESRKLIDSLDNKNGVLGVFTQKDAIIDKPSREDLYDIGTLASVLKVFELPDGSITVILHGRKRIMLGEQVQQSPFIKCKVWDKSETDTQEQKSKIKTIIEELQSKIKTLVEKPTSGIPSELIFAVENIKNDLFLINFIAAHMNISIEEKYRLLTVDTLYERGVESLSLLEVELKKQAIIGDIQNKVHVDLTRQQKEYFLNQQMKAIQDELGGNSSENDLQEFKEKAKSKKWSEKNKETFEKELKKLERMNPQIPDYSIQRNFIEFLLELPWEDYSKDKFDLKRAEKILNRDHYGLDDVKKRILEYIAVLKLKGNMRSPILCLYGPPGVGKTSLGKSVAESLGRKYVRMSLGGLHDESEIRGHRKTYIGAMPGRVLNSIKKAGSSNPVFVLDEIDKISVSAQADPSSAMLEVLDPEQNSSFYDNYLEQGYDLSKVLFIATANSLSSIQPALLDRMEIIEINGYTIEEKIEIAKRHLLPKQLQEHGMANYPIKISDKVFEKIIDGYTRESGVRLLDKKIAQVVRFAAKSIVMKEEFSMKIADQMIEKILGVPRFSNKNEKNEVCGVVTGLAWTSVGGDILFIESICSPGEGKLTMTGNLGNVMKESATIALEYIKANAETFSINIDDVKKQNLHIHVPEGATPKDGPSAGISMLTSLVSSIKKQKVKDKLAMTGEITLRGKVLPVGGIKEKILAAKRAGITDIILSEDNKKDISEIKKEYIEGLNFHFVKTMKEVIDLALEK